MLTNVEIDRISRERIVSDIDCNFFVEAGAGSGKTTMLVNRMVAMIEAGADISEISAITFTKAAANEFYARFQKELIKRSRTDDKYEKKFAGQLPAPTKLTAERCSKALENIDLCFMGTIDSFCSMILSEHPFDAGIPSDATLISDDEAKVFYKQQYVKACEGQFGPEIAEYAKNYRKISAYPEDAFVAGTSFFMNNRNVHFNYNNIDSVDIDAEFAERRIKLLSAIRYLLKHRELAYMSNVNSIAAWKALAISEKRLSRVWSHNIRTTLWNLESILDLEICIGDTGILDRELGGLFIPKSSRGVYRINLDSRDGIYSALNDLCYDLSMSFIMATLPYVVENMRNKGFMIFFDYIYYLKEMLRNDAENEGKLINYIANRHKYYLLDEFQDTNPIQSEIFFYLAAEEVVPNWRKCKPRPGSLFIVGDPKQSIYRFRSADVTQYIKVRKLFDEGAGEVLYLYCNFRSTPVLLDFFNKSFTKILSEDSEDQSKFSEIPNENPPKTEFQGIFSYVAYLKKAMARYPHMADEIRIREIIKKIVNNNEFLITTPENPEPHKIDYDEIMVITYGKAKLGPISALLNKEGIPTKVEGKILFAENEALNQVYKLYSVVADVEDASALYNALTSRVLGFSRGDIIRFKAAGGMLSVKYAKCNEFEDDNKISDSDKEIIERVRKGINDLYELSTIGSKLSPAALFQNIIDKYEIFRFVKSDNLEVLYYTLELLRNAEKSGLVVSIKDGKNYIEVLLSGETEEERCLSLNKKVKAVHLANLHKVKGLEAPVVILASAGPGTFSPTYRIEHTENGAEGYVFEMDSEKDSNYNYYKFFWTSQYDDKKREETVSANAENLRLIYVAATRARNTLIICDSVYLDKYDNERSFGKWTPLLDYSVSDFFMKYANCPDGEKKTKSQVDAEALYKEAAKTSVLSNRKAQRITYDIMVPSQIKSASKLDDNATVLISPGDIDNMSTKDEELSVVHEYPTILGTMVHRLMEIVVSTKDNYEGEAAINEIINEYLLPNAMQYEEQFRQALKKVYVTIHNGGYRQQSKGVPQNILAAVLDADEVFCEVPFCYEETDDDDLESEAGEKRSVLWNGVMDLIYRKGEKWHIIDYKTNAVGSGLDSKYAGQLDSYVQAFRAITGNDADAYIYHIDI